MVEPILDYDSFFEGAKSALLELDTLSTEEERLRTEGDRVTKAIEAEKKAVEGRIAETTSKRLKEITSTYDAEIKKAEDIRKSLEAKKGKAKSKKVSERIAEETKEVVKDVGENKMNNLLQ